MTNQINTKKNKSCQSSKLSKRQIAHREFINSPEWEVIRQRLFKSRGKRCEICGKESGVQVHHINYDRFGGDELDTDLIILCGNHHMKAHGLRSESDKEKALRIEHEEMIGVPWCYRMEYEKPKKYRRKKKKKRKKKKRNDKYWEDKIEPVLFKDRIILRKRY